MADGRKSSPDQADRACDTHPIMDPTHDNTVNNARAMRVAEIINDFRSIQYHIAALQVTPRAEEYYLEGYAWLRHCVAEAQAVLTQNYPQTGQDPQGDPEQEKSLLKLYVILRLQRRHPVE
jgi:hypothetical protein